MNEKKPGEDWADPGEGRRRQVRKTSSKEVLSLCLWSQSRGPRRQTKRAQSPPLRSPPLRIASRCAATQQAPASFSPSCPADSFTFETQPRRRHKQCPYHSKRAPSRVDSPTELPYLSQTEVSSEEHKEAWGLNGRQKKEEGALCRKRVNLRRRKRAETAKRSTFYFLLSFHSVHGCKCQSGWGADSTQSFN